MITPADPHPSSSSAAALAAPGLDPLAAFLSGKRAGERLACHVPAVLHGACGPAAATLLDLSESGALVQIDDPAFLEAEARGGMPAYLELVQVHANGDIKLGFPGRDLTLGAAIVRWTAGSAGGEPSRLGLKFKRALSADEMTALRSGAALPLRAAPTGLASMPAAPTHAPRRGERFSALLFHALKPELGPLMAGQIVALGPDVVVLHLEGEADEARVAARLSSGALFLSVQRHGLTTFEKTARPGALRRAPDGRSLHVALLGTGPVPPALVPHLRRA